MKSWAFYILQKLHHRIMTKKQLRASLRTVAHDNMTLVDRMDRMKDAYEHTKLRCDDLLANNRRLQSLIDEPPRPVCQWPEGKCECMYGDSNAAKTH
jgi:hypothetical protein